MRISLNCWKRPKLILSAQHHCTNKNYFWWERYKEGGVGGGGREGCESEGRWRGVEKEIVGWKLLHLQLMVDWEAIRWTVYTSYIPHGPVAQRIRHLTTDQGIPGSNPGRVAFFFFFFFFSLRSTYQKEHSWLLLFSWKLHKLSFFQ